MAPSTKTAVVVADVVAWTTPRQGKPDDPAYHRASRGATIELPVAEFDRLAKYSAVAEPGVAEQAQLERDALDVGLYTDEELAALNASELAAYVNQHPEEGLRVWTLETARRKPRVTVLEASGYEAGEDGQPVRVIAEPPPAPAAATPGTGVVETGDGTPAVTT